MKMTSDDKVKNIEMRRLRVREYQVMGLLLRGQLARNGKRLLTRVVTTHTHMSELKTHSLGSPFVPSCIRPVLA
jgi:hypothetical protein